MTKIYYVRHGETNQNKNKLLTGRRNIRLNEVGKTQAEKTAEVLKNIEFDFAFCSPLTRAKQTAKILNKHHNLNFITDERLIERDWGVFTEQSTSSIDREIAWNYYLDTTKYTDLESVKDVFKRVYSFIDFLKAEYKNKTILVVAHSGVGRAFHCYFNGIPEDGYLLKNKLENASVTIYEF